MVEDHTVAFNSILATDGLSPKLDAKIQACRVLTKILAGSNQTLTVSDIAWEMRVHESVVRRLFDSPEFKDLLNQALLENVSQDMASVREHLMGIVRDPSAKPSDRVSASRTIVTLFKTLHDVAAPAAIQDDVDKAMKGLAGILKTVKNQNPITPDDNDARNQLQREVLPPLRRDRQADRVEGQTQDPPRIHRDPGDRKA